MMIIRSYPAKHLVFLTLGRFAVVLSLLFSSVLAIACLSCLFGESKTATQKLARARATTYANLLLTFLSQLPAFHLKTSQHTTLVPLPLTSRGFLLQDTWSMGYSKVIEFSIARSLPNIRLRWKSLLEIRRYLW